LLLHLKHELRATLLDGERDNVDVPYACSWFVECSREKAEAILSLSRQYGSLLLRPVSRSDPNSKYAISYRVETAGSVVFHCFITFLFYAGAALWVLSPGRKIQCSRRRNSPIASGLIGLLQICRSPSTIINACLVYAGGKVTSRPGVK